MLFFNYFLSDEDLAILCDGHCYTAYLACKDNCDSSGCERTCLTSYTSTFFSLFIIFIIFKPAIPIVPVSTTVQMAAMDAQTRFAAATSRRRTTATTSTAWIKRRTTSKRAQWARPTTRPPTICATITSRWLQKNARATPNAALAVHASLDSNAKRILWPCVR